MADSRICSIPDCGKPSKTKGFCSAHYSRLLRNGDASVLKTTPNGEALDHYRIVVLLYEGDDCLIWPYSRHESGRGVITIDGRGSYVSRFLCEDIYGPPPTPDHQAAHSCGKGHLGCVTKRHLRWATREENEADKIIHGTHTRGERCHFSKLTIGQAAEILSLKGKDTQEAIAALYGVSRTIVSKIHSRKIWPELGPLT